MTGVQTCALPIFANFFIQQAINHFDFCWVPDFPGEPNLGGRLSHPEKISDKVRYIGPVSRFLPAEKSPPVHLAKTFDTVVILSGPEPQRSILEKTLIQKLRNTEYNVLIIRGIPWKKQGQTIFKKIQLVSHLPDELFLAYIQNAKYLICRPGYSSLMDLSILGLSAIIIPTPGQTEQEYLGEKMKEEGSFFCMEQDKIDLVSAFHKIKRFKPNLPPVKPGWLEKALEELS